MGIWKQVGKQLLQRRGVEPPDGMFEAVKGLDLAGAVRWCNEQLGLSIPIKEGVAEAIQIVKDAYCTSIPAKPFAREFLTLLRQQGVHICAASNSEPDYLEPALRRLGLWELLDSLVSASQLQVSKENPDFWRQVARHMGARPEQLTVFEDALYAMKTAKQAGCRVVAVYDEAERENNAEIRKVCDYYAGGFAPFVK
ncbi:MAG: HAD family phosphatase [Pygmaiobacter massiliensis]|nr:HAD family phosphatase [Pygmaiobacter massiliensis]